MANKKVCGFLEEGFYIIKPLHCSNCIGACRAGFAGIGYLDAEKEKVITSDGIEMSIIPEESERIDALKPSNLEPINNAKAYAETYRRRAEFIESRL